MMRLREPGFHGVFSAMVTPMTRAGLVDEPKLEELTEYLIDAGVHGLTPLGSTGEFYALSALERERVLARVMSAVAGRVPVVPGTNAGSTRDCVAFSREAEKLGCAGVMLAAPYYSLPTHDELLAHFKAINDAIGIPMMIYNYPGRTGVDMPPEFLARLADKCKNVKCVKESTGDMARIATLKRLCGDRVGVFCGCDTIALQAFVMGANGWLGGVVNVLPRGHVAVYESAARGDFAGARSVFEKMLPVLELMEGGGRYTCFVKAGCGLMGRQVGLPRMPLGPATAKELATLKQALKACAGME